MRSRNIMRLIALALVSVMMLFAVGCDISSFFEEIDDLQNMTDISRLSESYQDMLKATDGVSNNVESEKLTQEGDNNELEMPEPPEFVLPLANNHVIRKHDPTVQVFYESTQDYRVHLGVDIASLSSSQVYAAAAGTIEKIWTDAEMGECMMIAHSGGYYTVYKNLAKTRPNEIKSGAQVDIGQPIGWVGHTATVEAADKSHLHFEIMWGEELLDPMDHINFEE